jgi:hypothetical protein
MDLQLLFIALIVVAAGSTLIGAVYVVLNQQIALERTRQNAELRLKAFTSVMPLKLQAYERVILYLERIHPASLLPRAEPAGKTARLLAEQLKLEVTSELEHNVVQQLYMKQASWQRVQMACDALLTLIEISRKDLPDTATGLDLAQAMLDRVKQMEVEFPTVVAAQAIRRELEEILEAV